ncbi:MAG: phenylacetate--CoA ligase family protein [Armatimonadota bacterium]
MPIWNRRCETMARSDLQQLQLERLQATVNRAYRNVRFYRRRFRELGVEPEDIQSLDDIRRLPFTTREDLKAAYPYEMLSVPLREIVRLHSSAGAGDEAVVVGYTRNDLRTWSELVARVISAGEVTKRDVVQITFSYGLFTGGLGLHHGAERVGASVIPVSTGSTERQIRIMQDFKTTALVGTPSYALHIADVMDQMGVDPRTLSLRVGLFGGEPFPERTRQEIESRLRIMATDNYGLSEVMGPGVSGECKYQCGLHINEDHFLVEVVDPKTLEVLPYGEQGELVITTLTKEGMVLLRYRTRDLTSLDPEPCRCGRTNVRMGKVLGRTDDMLIIRGVKVFPSQIRAVLQEVEGIEPHYQIVIEREAALDELTILVEVSPEIFPDEVSRLMELEQRIRSRIESVTGLTPKLRLVEPKTLAERTGGEEVVDRRSPQG